MAEITESRMAMYEGMIALAWADHVLTDEEKQALHEMIDGNLRFDDAQRATLHNEVDNKVELSSVWPRITEKADRAHLLDVANFIFHKDGEFCATEEELYNNFLSKHLATLDSEATINEVRELARERRAAREANAAEMEALREEYRNAIFKRTLVPATFIKFVSDRL